MKILSVKRFENATFDWTVNALLLFVIVVIAIPLWYVFIVSVTPFGQARQEGFNLFLPLTQWSFTAYQQLLGQDTFVHALLISVIITISGVMVNMVLTTLTAYALTFKSLPGRNLFLTLILFTFLFNAGLVPTYLMVKNLNLLNTLPAVILPNAINVYYLFVMKVFFQNLPTSLREAAIMDGANELQVLWHVVLPLSRPILLTIGLFYAVEHWNDFFQPILYLSDQNLMPLPVLLRNILISVDTNSTMRDVLATVPQDSLKMAAVLLTMIPMLIIYPWIQRHFTKGVLLGGVKE